MDCLFRKGVQASFGDIPLELGVSLLRVILREPSAERP
jgi:hypothetical protein